MVVPSAPCEAEISWQQQISLVFDISSTVDHIIQLFAKTLATALVEKNKLRDHEK